MGVVFTDVIYSGPFSVLTLTVFILSVLVIILLISQIIQCFLRRKHIRRRGQPIDSFPYVVTLLPTAMRRLFIAHQYFA